MSQIGQCDFCGAAGVLVEMVDPERSGCVDTAACKELRELNVKKVPVSIDQPDGNVPPGTKRREGKMRWFSLLPWDALTPVMRVLEKGAKIYAPNNWRQVEPPEDYLEAAARHLQKMGVGETHDPETGELHAAHAVCCLLFYIGTRWKEETK